MSRKRLDALEHRFGVGSPECHCQLLRFATDGEIDNAIRLLTSAGDGELPDADLRQLEAMEAEWRRRCRSNEQEQRR